MYSEAIVAVPQVEDRILLIRGQRVLLDSDLAELYEVPTKALNQAVKRNLNRFPADFMFQEEGREVEILRSQIVTLRHGQFRKYAPNVYTEHGVAPGDCGEIRASRMAPAEQAQQIQQVFETIKQLVDAPDPDEPKRRYGFPAAGDFA